MPNKAVFSLHIAMKKMSDRLLCCNGTRARDLAPTSFRRRIPPESCGAKKAVCFNRVAYFYVRHALRKWRKRGVAGSQKHWAVCADRFAEKRTACAGGVFIGAKNFLPITRKSPLHQSADRRMTAVSLSRPQVLKLQG
jgi:hypothetical protein